MAPNKLEGFRLSAQQRYLWSLSAPSQVLSMISIAGELRPEMLERALAGVIERHEILRTTFQRPPGIKIPFQVISDEAQFEWQFHDLSDLDPEALSTKLEISLLAMRSGTFDFERGPLLRAKLYRLAREHHALLISVSALCADSVTILNLMNELGGEFAAEPLQYADFAEWHNELLESADEHADEGRRYWLELMAQQASKLNLPLEKRTDQTVQPEAVSIDFYSTCIVKLEALAREHETSIQVVLFACWQALVWRLTNQSQFVIFNLSDGRKLADMRVAMGAYAKYLPVVCHGENVSLATLVDSAREAISNAEEWQEYFDPNTFLEAARDSVAFDFAEQPPMIEHDGLRLSLARHEIYLGQFKLRLSCFRSRDSIRAELLYDARHFDRETVKRYAGYFTKLVTQTSTNIDILGADERKLLLDINHTASEFSETKCIHYLFEEQAARTPTAKALVCDDRELTYAELNEHANRLAHLLRSRGLTPNARVAICMDRSAETIVALLAILKAGGAYVPLNPQHPAARLCSQLAQSNVSILITKGATLEFGGEIIDLDSDLLLAQPDVDPALVNSSADLAYVIYTSGSSGLPKGVAVDHRALVNYTQFILRRLHVTEPLQFGTVSTITADLGNTCIFPALVSGGCLHLISYDVAMEAPLFSAYVAKNPIDVLKIVPSHLNALLASGAPDILPRKYLILGGEALSWELVDRVFETKPACKVINHYGPTETTVGSLTFDVRQHEQSLTTPIGRPIANTQAYILDSQLNLAPTGAAGELYIGGAGLSWGYLNQPVETAARFVPNPFSNEPGARLYRTGDMARYLSDQNIEFLGRIDHQVKVRGFRVELREIEVVLLKHDEIREAVVIAEAERLVGYVVASGSKPLRVEDLRKFLGRHLPDYMIPATFVSLKTLPLTANGKIDRARLPAPEEARPDLERVFVAPRTAVEKQLADIWSEFLKFDEMGVHDNFFELGGHSLLATQVVSRIRKTFNCEMLLRSLFEAPTIAQLATQIEADTERLLAEIEQLSDEEVELLLKSEQL